MLRVLPHAPSTAGGEGRCGDPAGDVRPALTQRHRCGPVHLLRAQAHLLAFAASQAARQGSAYACWYAAAA